MQSYKNIQVCEFVDIGDWRNWLEDNYAQTEGVWLKIAKKGAPTKTITYEEARESALCYGWIDSVPNKLDESFYPLKVTPRRKGSVWSRVNVELCEAYIRDGKMTSAGLREINLAQADGRWENAYGGRIDTKLPPDLEQALLSSPKAKETFETTNNTNRNAIIYNVSTAKRPETRLRRIQNYISMLEKGEVPFPRKQIS